MVSIEPKLTLGSLKSVLHTENKIINSSGIAEDSPDDSGYSIPIKLPGADTAVDKFTPYAEGSDYDGKAEHDGMMSFIDKTVTNDSKAPIQSLAEDIDTHDSKSAFSTKDTELIFVINDDNPDGFLYTGAFGDTVHQGISLNITDNLEFTADILKTHRVNENWFCGNDDGRNDTAAVIEDILNGKTIPVFSSSCEDHSKVGTDNSANENEKFIRNVIKYFGHHMGVERDYISERDAEHNPKIQKATLVFIANYFRTIDHHMKHDSNDAAAKNSLKRMLPIFVEELGYAQDETILKEGDPSYNGVAKNLLSVRSLMKAPLELNDNDNLISHLANQFGLNEVDVQAKDATKLKDIEKAFTPVREMLIKAPDFKNVSADYVVAYREALKSAKLDAVKGLTDAMIDSSIKRFILDSDRIDELKTTGDGKEGTELLRLLESKQSGTSSKPSIDEDEDKAATAVEDTPLFAEIPKTVATESASWIDKATDITKATDNKYSKLDQSMAWMILDSQNRINLFLTDTEVVKLNEEDKISGILSILKDSSYASTLKYMDDSSQKQAVKKIMGTF